MAVDCTSKGMYESLSWCPGQTSTPGIRRKVFFIPKSWIEKWPVLPAIDGAESMAALATYDGDFVLAADKKWQYIELLTTKSSISAESQGEVPSKTILNKATLVHAGTDEEASGFCRQANIDELIFLCQQKNGKFRVIGSEAFDPSVTISQTSGEGDTGTAGTTLEAQCTDVCPAPFYMGKIETEDGDISGANGSAIVPGG